MIIAIDGPAGSGKSTVARRLAARLGLTFLDTGAMYRAVTLTVLERGLDPGDGAACGQVAQGLDLRFDSEGRILIHGEPGEPRIRGTLVDREVPRVAAHPAVRSAVVPKQRRIAAAAQAPAAQSPAAESPAAESPNVSSVPRNSVEGQAAGGGIVAEGRDTTTVVFPAADHKFFLIASLQTRALRRARQEGHPEQVAEVQADIERRDHLDSSRSDSPLALAPGAEQIDTDGLSVDEVVQRILDHMAG